MDFVNKKTLRNNFKKIKSNIPKDIKFLKDCQIKEKLLDMREYYQSNVILGYMANDIEVNIDDILCMAIDRKKKVAIPRCEIQNGIEKMNYYFVDNFDNLIVNKFLIREPDSNRNKIFINNLNYENIIMFIPAIVYDRRGYRVGYGRGYFDRYLSECRFKILKIGLVYDIAVIDKIDKEENDVPVDILVTESQIVRLN